MMMDVIIPAFNARHSIEQSVSSATMIPNARVTVVDDGSSDDTAVIAKAAGARVISQTNGGAASARAAGVKATAGRYVIFLDADDELIPAGVIHSMALLEENPQASVAAGRVIGRDGRNERLLPSSYPIVSPTTLIEGGRGPWPPAAAVVRRSSLEAARNIPIPELQPKYAEDYEMFIRLAMVGESLAHSEPSTRYTLFGGKSTSGAIRALRDKEAIRAHYASHLGVSIVPMTDREISAAAAVRRLRSSNSQRNKLGTLRAALALAAYPDFVLSKLKNAKRQHK